MLTRCPMAALACASAAFSTTNLQVRGVTSTQAIISYTAPNASACTIQASQSSGLTPLAYDVDPNTFANSNSDLSRASTVVVGLSRTVVIGQRTSQFATAGAYSGTRHFSRALQALTLYYGAVTCNAVTTNFTFTTGNIPLGSSYGDPPLVDTSHAGQQPWPESLGTATPESFIDPFYGTQLYRIGLRGNLPSIYNFAFGTAFNQGQTTPCDSAGPWTNPCNVVTDSGNTTVGNSQAPLILRPDMNVNPGVWSSSYNTQFSLDQLGLSLTGLVNSSTYNVIDVCMSLNGGASCASANLQLTLGTSSSTQTVGQAPTIYSAPTQWGTTSWELNTYPRLNLQEASPHRGTANVSGNTVTWVSGDLFSLYWATGGFGNIRLSSNNDACISPPTSTTSTEYAITGFIDGNNLTVAGSPPTGSNLFWCADNFALMLWRDAAPLDSSTVTLTNAVLNVLGSFFPGYPDNGAGTACFNKPVDGGYFCFWSTMFWVNPTGPSVAWYGQPQGGGNGITNAWDTTGITPESASIDQTASVPTWYMVGRDLSHTTPLVIRGTYTPGSTPTQPSVPQSSVGVSQVQNATVSSTDAYSVTWSNGMVFTNLTPHVSLSESVFSQATALDSSFNPYYFVNGTNGLNCGISGAATRGVFFLSCYSRGGDSPAWTFAFAPGDGNPAHAGQAGGPRIIGAINTFNTPNPLFQTTWPLPNTRGMIVGRSLHAMVETGETGWLNITTNDFFPQNTSNTNIPATSAACNTFTGLSSWTGTCVLVQINSYTFDSVTGYEPYFPAPPVPPFFGTPGELRTTQIGDTACIGVSTDTICNFADGSHEAVVLAAKNYNGVNGAWVLQRNAYGSQLAVTGPIKLFWESFQRNIPVGATSPPSGQVYWNPTTGCGGSPDPHGNCLIVDTNQTSGHGEWRNGGEAVTTNVPLWQQPIWGQPSDYQTILGSVPGILGFPFANVTPNQAAGVNYVQTNPSFSGVFGHPWGSDSGSHPNPPGVNATPNEVIRAFDNIPVQGGQNEPTFTNVTGQLYVATPTSVIDADDPFGYGGTPNGIVAINRKLMATGATCGPHPVADISGPSSSIPSNSSGSYEYCIVRVAGECRGGSTVGQVYVNCPGVTTPSCVGVATHGGMPFGQGSDICVGNINNTSDAITQFTLNQTDYPGAYSRSLVSATAWKRMVYGFENNQLLPDNSWVLYRAEWLNFNRAELWMAKLPSFPAADSVNRGTFVPVVLNLNPPASIGVNNAVVRFGYAEYGAPSALNCTTRSDICLATTPFIPTGNSPFRFASETPAGVACVSGCTVTIPAISQRTLYWQVLYRNGSNAVISQGPIQVTVVP